jgi:hypothetical protein
MSDKVGPGRPPISSRFRKGQSGNLKGRPKGSAKTKLEKATSAFEILFEKTLTVTVGDVSREIAVDEALWHRTYQDAIQGNRVAQGEVLKMIARREKALDVRSSRKVIPAEYRMEHDPDNTDQALLILGIASYDPALKEFANMDREPLLLEPWAVQAALSRRRGGSQLSDQNVADIKRCTRDADALRWPRGTDE